MKQSGLGPVPNFPGLQKLTRSFPAGEFDSEDRRERALTLSLMRLLAKRTLIAQRLAKLGRRKLATPEPAAVGGEKKTVAG